MTPGKKVCHVCGGTGYVDDRNWVARRIQELRKRRKLSIEQLAERSGILLTTLQSLESGGSTPPLTWAHVVKLCKAFTIDLNTFGADTSPRPRRRR